MPAGCVSTAADGVSPFICLHTMTSCPRRSCIHDTDFEVRARNAARAFVPCLSAVECFARIMMAPLQGSATCTCAADQHVLLPCMTLQQPIHIQSLFWDVMTCTHLAIPPMARFELWHWVFHPPRQLTTGTFRAAAQILLLC